MLKLNDDKAEVILFTSKYALKSHPNVAVTVGEQPVRPATYIHNLGVVYDQPLSMIQHVNSVCRVGYMHVRNIGRIRRYLTEDATKTIVHALVTSRLDCAIRFIRVSNQHNAATTKYMRTNDYEDKTP